MVTWNFSMKRKSKLSKGGAFSSAQFVGGSTDGAMMLALTGNKLTI